MLHAFKTDEGDWRQFEAPRRTETVRGRIGKDAGERTARDGKPWAAFPVAVDAKTDGEAPATWVRVALFGDAGGLCSRPRSYV